MDSWLVCWSDCESVWRGGTESGDGRGLTRIKVRLCIRLIDFRGNGGFSFGCRSFRCGSFLGNFSTGKDLVQFVGDR